MVVMYSTSLPLPVHFEMSELPAYFVFSPDGRERACESEYPTLTAIRDPHVQEYRARYGGTAVTQQILSKPTPHHTRFG